jgi:uncharacterized protein (DUF1697 family)
MQFWVMLLRGINVGGNNIVPMKQLTSMLNILGCENVKTYIQSGNVLLHHSQPDGETLTQKIAMQMQLTFGFEPKILLLTLEQFQQAASNNPFVLAQAEPKTLHLFFLSNPVIKLNVEKLNSFKKINEDFKLINQVFYLHAPDGIGRSKLAEKVESILTVPTTARNWNTVSKLLSLANQI